ncbi:MAG: four helix bundle protein [Phycisphaerae bacterium]
MSRIRTYRDLIAWRKSMDLASMIYRETRRLPEAERYGLIAQLRRAAVSIPSNIAEGYARQTTSDYLRYLRIARGSLAEVSTQLELAIELHLMPANEELTSQIEEVDRILQGLIRSLQQTTKKAAIH